MTTNGNRSMKVTIKMSYYRKDLLRPHIKHIAIGFPPLNQHRANSEDYIRQRYDLISAYLTNSLTTNYNQILNITR